jgi:hypothetical protein
MEKGKLFLLEMSLIISLMPTYNRKNEIPKMKNVSITIIFIYLICVKKYKCRIIVLVEVF